MNKGVSFCLLACGIGAASAADIRLAGPVSGLLYNRVARAVQPMLGVPGGAWLGAPVVSDVDWAVVAPDGRQALVGRGGEACLVRSLPDAAHEGIRLGKTSRAALAAWNLESSAAVLRTEAGLLLVGDVGLVELESPAGPVSALAVDGSGKNVLAITGSAVYLLSPGLPPRLLMGIDGGGAVAVHRQSAFVAGQNQVFEIRNFAEPGGAQVRPLHTARDGLSDITGLACSRDGRRLLIADRGLRTVTVYDPGTGAPAATIELDFVPDGIELVAGSELYLLKPGGGPAPFYVLAGGPVPGVYFVPAGGSGGEE
ncbi:MAG: hypothetical protein AAB225_22415 [Acidobacteriota bacterium]